MILATCFLLDSDAFLISSAVGSVCDAGPGPLLFQRPFEGEQCDTTRDAAAVEATLSTGSGNHEGGNPKPTTSPYLDPTTVVSESTCSDSSRSCPPSLVSHSVGVRGSEADEEARGDSARLQGVPSSLESIQQSVAAGSLNTNLGETDAVMEVAAVEGTGVNPELGEQRDGGRRTSEEVEASSQELGSCDEHPKRGSKQEPLLGAVTSALHDDVTCDAGKDLSNSGGGESAAPELHLLRTVDLEAGPRKRNTDCSSSKSVSCLISDHGLLPVETGAQERGTEVFEGMNTLGIDTDFVETMEASSDVRHEGTTPELLPLRNDLVKPESGPHQQIPDLEGVSVDIPGPFISPAADVEAGNQQLIDGTNSLIFDTNARDLEDRIQFTVSAIPETSASCNNVLSVTQQEGDPHGSSTGGGEMLGDHAVELETEQDLQVCSGSLSSPVCDVYPSSEVDPGAQEPRVAVVEGDGSKILGVETDAVEAIPEAAVGGEGDDAIDPPELSYSRSVSSPLYHTPTVELEEQEGVVVKGGVLDVDTNAGGAVETIEFAVTESPEASSNTAKNAASSTMETPPEGGDEKREDAGAESNTLRLDSEVGGSIETIADASASLKIDTYDGHQEEIPDEGESLALESPPWGIAVEPRPSLGKQSVLSNSKGT